MPRSLWNRGELGNVSDPGLDIPENIGKYSFFCLGNWIAGFRGFKLMEINSSSCFLGRCFFVEI